MIDYHLTPSATVKKTTISKWYPVSSGGAYPLPYYIWSIVLVLFSYPATIPEQTMTELGTKQEQIYHPEKTSIKTTAWLWVLTFISDAAIFQLSPETTRCQGRQPSGLTAPAQVARVMKVRMTRCQGRQSLTHDTSASAGRLNPRNWRGLTAPTRCPSVKGRWTRPSKNLRGADLLTIPNLPAVNPADGRYERLYAREPSRRPPVRPSVTLAGAR